MAPGVTQVVFGGRFSPNVEESPARLSCQHLARSRGRDYESYSSYLG